MGIEWTRERIDVLKKLWGEGYTGQAIADHIGLGLSRSAILGKVNSLGLSRSRSSFKRPRKKAKPPVAAKPIIKFDPPIMVVRKSLAELGARECHYPMGDPHRAGFHYCGAPTSLGKTFCDSHHKLCHAPNQRKKGGRFLLDNRYAGRYFDQKN